MSPKASLALNYRVPSRVSHTDVQAVIRRQWHSALQHAAPLRRALRLNPGEKPSAKLWALPYDVRRKVGSVGLAAAILISASGAGIHLSSTILTDVWKRLMLTGEVALVGYNQAGLQVLTWGVVTAMSWDLFFAYGKEAWAVLCEHAWLKPDGMTPSGLTAAQLVLDFGALKTTGAG